MTVARTPKTKAPSSPSKLVCLRCGEVVDIKRYYSSRSGLYAKYGRLPICQNCLDEVYDEYLDEYKKKDSLNPEKKAVERVCMAFDVYYCDKLFESALKGWENDGSFSLISYYMQRSRLKAYITKTYDDTMKDKLRMSIDDRSVKSIYDDTDADMDARVKEAIEMFGKGMSRDDYLFLYDKYKNWTARHECNTMSQEENFKRICMVQLQLWKADVAGDIGASKQLNEQYLKLTDASKLMPKQNTGDATADNQTLGTLIEKWENTRPIPECDEELKDVDKIGVYLDTFFRGHLAKSLGIKNSMSLLYDKFMAPYTVQKPEYKEDENNESLFEAVFGNTSVDDDISEYLEDDGDVV